MSNSNQPDEEAVSEKARTGSQEERVRGQRELQKPSAVFEMPDLAVPGEAVSEAEVEFFKENGFIVKKGMIDPDRLAAAMDRIWAHLIENVPVLESSGWQLARDDRSTWVNPQWAEMPPHPDSGPFQGRQPIEYFDRIVKLHDIGTEDYLLDLLPNDPAVQRVATALLDDDLRPSICTRGVYAVFPKRIAADQPDGGPRLTGAALIPHVDQVCQQLNACLYLDDVRPRNGGFTVYPGSHELTFQEHEYEANWSPRPSYRDAVRRMVETIEPYELVAERGSVVFWHGRTVHTAGIHTGDDIRWALFADFTQNREVLSEDEHRRVGQYEWFKNAKLFKEDWPVGDDMWRHWKVGQW